MKNKKPLHKQERGAALVWIAGLMVVLLAMASFATDLGWILLQSSRLQSAADAAALAGVVNLPAFPSGATADAELAAGSNGFPVPSAASLAGQILPDNSYRVTLDTDVNTFFLKVLGFQQFHLSRTATAQYIKPVRLGSNDNDFGDPNDQFWAAVNAEFTEIKQGDPYAAKCINNSGSYPPGCATTTSACTAADLIGFRSECYRPEGYYYAIDVLPGSTGDLSLEIYDGGHFINTGGGGTSNTGDRSWQPSWGGVSLEYSLYPPDDTPSDPTDNASKNGFVDKCGGNTTFATNPSPASAGHFNSWSGPKNCTINGPIAQGIWVLQVPSPLVEGATKFGIRATMGGSPRQPKVYGLLDMSLYVNFSNNLAEPYLAEVRPEHANRELLVSIWDLGDVDAAASITFLTPSGTPPTCSWTSSNNLSDSGSCVIDISNQRFNAEWLWVRIPIPGTYTCNPDPDGNGDPIDSSCWWKLRIQSSGQTHDRTTWAAQITGDPVRLTP